MTGPFGRLLGAYVWLVYAFMYAPILLMGLFSLNSAELMAFPLKAAVLSLAWWGFSRRREAG